MKGQAGFTLVEALTAGVISTVLAGALLSILYMCNDQIEESLERQDAVALYTAVADHFRAVASRAAKVRSTDEAGGGFDLPVPAHPGDVHYEDVVFFDAADAAIGGFRIQDNGVTNELMEWSPGVGWVPYTVAGTPIEMDEFQAPGFSISPGRRSATFKFNLRFTKNGKTTTHLFQRQRAQCKNRFP